MVEIFRPLTALGQTVKKGRGRAMRLGVVLGVLAAALIVGLSSCVYVPVEPAPAYGYVGPVPLTPAPMVSYRRCARGWHWVHGHYNQRGQWVRAHCARNWVNPSGGVGKYLSHQPATP